MIVNHSTSITLANSAYLPKFSLQDVLYPEISPYDEGKLKVSDLHTLWYAQFGNPKGLPVLVLHGGPGFGCGPNDMRYFDPNFYRIILVDQRGSKRSIPLGEVRENTTSHLISDINCLKNHLNIDKWLLFGGSWGSAFALLYGIEYPESCLGFILRGIFLATEAEMKQVWYGMQDVFPDAWEEMVNHLLPEERSDLIASYTKRVNHPDPLVHYAAARSFMKYDLTAAYLNADTNFLKNFLEDKDFILSGARIFTHYCSNNFFVTQSTILNNLNKINHLSAIMVQGRYDIICRSKQAYILHKAWPDSQLTIIPESGHSAMEIGTSKALVEASNFFREKIGKTEVAWRS